MLLQLPDELLDAIAANLRRSRSWATAEGLRVKEDQMSFSLICRRCRNIGQAHAFRDLVYSFRYAKDGQRWPSLDSSEMLPMDPSWKSLEYYPHTSLPMLRDFFKEHPFLGTSMRRLRLVGYPGDNNSIIESRCGDLVQFADNDLTDVLFFHNLLSLLPSLQELQLADFFLALPEGYWQAPCIAPQSLKRLLIEYPHGKQYEDHAADIIACFNFVDEVLVSNLDRPEVEDFAVVPRRLDLTSFAFFGDTVVTGRLFQHILASPATQTLRKLDIGFIQPDSPAHAAFKELLHAVGPQLEHFGLNVTGRWQGDTSISLKLDLSPCINLRSLLFRLFIRKDFDVAEGITNTSRTCRSCGFLQTITIETSDIFEPTLSIRKIEDELLVLKKRIPLSVVRIRTPLLDIYPPLTPANVEQLKRCFPRLVEQNLLDTPS